MNFVGYAVKNLKKVIMTDQIYYLDVPEVRMVIRDQINVMHFVDYFPDVY